MFRVFRERIRQGHKTIAFPRAEPLLPERYRGLPQIDSSRCPEGNCNGCFSECPAGALSRGEAGLVCDLGRCTFCGACAEQCPHGAISFTKDYRQATRSREELVCTGEAYRLASALDAKMLKLFGRSLQFRHVHAGDCNGCAVDVNVLTTVVFDLDRFGIKIVAAPRHADGIIVTGPIPRNMELALKKTYAAIAHPKLVVAIGACAISGGLFRGHEEICPDLNELMPVDLYIPGCPPHPITILDGLLRMLNRR